MAFIAGKGVWWWTCKRSYTYYVYPKTPLQATFSLHIVQNSLLYTRYTYYVYPNSAV